eukprot:CAMPEP_0117420174 /NCGR_PEP_ID=MMETSP0758-20121206/1563_1 /TAXON_ID=63605 /ORGANISM="Percolomonas cosmopolitus, Strain AE-1 (ATCC 50343)" /LENGTH=83 /DNA_ID=CAMNT_0005201629 /DNA_START=610 /DNA_END=858 /DNA_ORIENTATION=+
MIHIFNGSLIQFGTLMIHLSGNIESCLSSMNNLAKDLPVVSNVETVPYQSMLDEWMCDDDDPLNDPTTTLPPYYGSLHNHHSM